eukprot:TRINITY_DN28659_c0_g1_i2.p1 TRINITY_DN28659_c0_g1~~TRINITY_DN28659_c0_g1_i2.p1  ORF type:complete len:635 (-),score=67.71 TRINITY_DN28659_c0_g1_i2:162-2066(-)
MMVSLSHILLWMLLLLVHGTTDSCRDGLPYCTEADESGALKLVQLRSRRTATEFQLPDSEHVFVMSSPAELHSFMRSEKGSAYLATEPLPTHKDYASRHEIPRTLLLQPHAEIYDLSSYIPPIAPNGLIPVFRAIIGLGEAISDVKIILPEPLYLQQGFNSPQNIFFRTLQNLEILNSLTTAHAQMVPFRRLHIRGNFTVLGGSVGGTLADSIVEQGIVIQGSQEENFINVTNKGDPFAGHPGCASVTYVNSQGFNETPCGQDFLMNSSAKVGFAVPATVPQRRAPPYFYRKKEDAPDRLRCRYRGMDYPIQYVSNDTLKSMALEAGHAYVLLPGVYFVEETLAVHASDVVIMGMGLPRIWASMRGPLFDIKGANVTLASMVTVAGPNQTDHILVDGESAHFYDITVTTLTTAEPLNFPWLKAWNTGRVLVETMLRIVQPFSVLENVWLWRGDHWDVNGSWPITYENMSFNPYGLIVEPTAHTTTCVGCYVEHQSCNAIYWQGPNGYIAFSQGETSYGDAGEVIGGYKPQLPLCGPYFVLDAPGFRGDGVNIYNIFGNKFGSGNFPALVLTDKATNTHLKRTLFRWWAATDPPYKFFEPGTFVMWNGTEYDILLGPLPMNQGGGDAMNCEYISM